MHINKKKHRSVYCGMSRRAETEGNARGAPRPASKQPRPFGVSRRLFGTTKSHSLHLDWPRFFKKPGQQRFNQIHVNRP